MKTPRNPFTDPWLVDSEFWITRLRRNDLERLAERYLPGKTAVVLDFGARHAPYRPIFSRAVQHFLTADLLNGRAEGAHDVVIEPDGRLRHPDTSVDVVLSLQVLEHVEDAAQYLREAKRILKPGGLLWLTTHGMWPYHPTPDDYHRWTLAGLRRLIGREFQIEETDALMGAPAYAVMIYQHWLWDAALRINALQARALNALTRSTRWGKTGPRDRRVDNPYLYLGHVAASLASVPLNLAIAAIDTLTPSSRKQADAAVFRIAARKPLE